VRFGRDLAPFSDGRVLAMSAASLDVEVRDYATDSRVRYR
jgi:hypothetical protein